MYIKKFQEGGAAPVAPEAAPAQEAPMGGQPGGDAAMQQIAQMAAQIIQELGPDAAMLLAQAIIELLQQSQGQEAQPVFKKGGKISAKCGTKMKTRK